MSKFKSGPECGCSASSRRGPFGTALAQRLAAMPCDQKMVLRMLQRITDDGENISLADERAAEQATMALDSLYIAYSRGTKPANAADVRAGINGFFSSSKTLPLIMPTISRPLSAASALSCNNCVWVSMPQSTEA